VLSFTTQEGASQRFATAHGFRHTNTIRISGVDPRTIEPRSAPPGVDLRPLASLDPRKVYELDAEAMLDVPGEVAMDDVSFEQWLEDYWASSGYGPRRERCGRHRWQTGRLLASPHRPRRPGGQRHDRDAA